tara:strand:+ start:1382 stop:7375 length:5994 start_codon:yes stop_codon:yes gene_type:complete
MSGKESPKLFLELGQVIKIIAPSNSAINDKNYYIEYLDNNKVKLINDMNLDDEIEIGIINGSLNDESITQINILATPEIKGYARQRDLIPENWITVEFGGDVPSIINGQITDLDEDEIEINIYGTEQKIYIDFGYKGIPDGLPIVGIRTFVPPELTKEVEKEETPEDLDEDLDEDLEDDEDLELIVDSEDIKQNIQNLFIDIDDIELGEGSLGEITEMVRVKESEKRFGIETQTQDILDELLSAYPTDKRSRKVLNNIHNLIERFKQLRIKFSRFDETGNAESILKKGANYKPLINNLKKLNNKLYWLIPVGRNSHKLFDLDIPEAEIFEDAEKMKYSESQNMVIEAQGQYKSNTVPDGQNKYTYLMQTMNPYFTPFSETSNSNNIITKKDVDCNLDIIINNLENFESNMVDGTNVSTRKYVIDRYNLGLSRLNNPDIKNKNSKAIRVPLTTNDTVDILGFLRLQEPYLKYSHINLPTTSIYDKTNLHFFNYFYFKILKNWAEGEEIVIKEGQEEEVMNKIENSQGDQKELLGRNTYFSFEERRKLIDRTSLGESDEIYNQFLENMIPKTKILFELVKKYIKNGTSYIKIIEYLEPFMIYTDDISFKQYETINEFIFEEINKHKKILIKNQKEFLKFIRSNKSYFVSTILPKLIKNDNQDIFDKSSYNITDNIDTEESLKKMISYDAGRLYNLALSISAITFSQPIDIESKITDELANLDSNLDEKKNSEESKKCEKQKTLVKRYITIEELTEDNNVPVFVDKKYDETPYDIGEEWKRNNASLIASTDDNELVIQALKEFLIENNGIENNKAQNDAEAMIYGSRAIQEEEYAYLDIQGDGNIKYYIRQNNIWKYDKSLSGMAPDQINFCNIKENCFKIKDSCANLDVTKDMLKINILEDIEKRFEEELIKSIQQLKSELFFDFKYRQKNLQSLKQLKIHKLLKNDIYQQRVASTLEERDIIVSPYELLRDEILSEIDIVKKFANLDKFIEQYCRLTNDDEDGNWYYCVDTDIKLLPTFFKDLVIGFNNNTYLLTLEKIYKLRGEKSGEGDKWVDKFSGYYISNDIALDYSEGYSTDGYKNNSREIMEEEMSDKLRGNRLRDTTQTYNTALARHIERILKTLDEKLYINTKSEYNFIIRIVMKSMNTNIPDEEAYKKLYAKKIKGGKKLITFEKKADQIEIYSIISAYIIAVQTIIPNIITKKVFGDCKKSFTGFPIDGNADLAFIEYLSCILFVLKREERPWNIIPTALSGKSKSRRKNYTEIKDKFVDKIKTFMVDKILSIDEIQQKLTIKREWNKKNKKTEIIIDEFDPQRWSDFLPPLIPITVTKLNNISGTFERTVKSRMEEGSYEQFAHLWALYGKITSYSFAIIESVQRVINNEPMLLETKGGAPFLENACCNDGEPRTNLYFSEKETSIRTHNIIVKNLTELYYRFKNMHKPVYFNFALNTKLVYPTVSNEFSKETIYLAFIKYCKFNSGIELEDGLKRICINNKCNFRNSDSITDKILAMEANSLNYTKETLNILLNNVNRQNILYYDLDPPVTTEKLELEETLEYLKGKKSGICHPKLLDYLQNIIDRFDVSIQGEDDEVVKEFTSYLDNINNKMSLKISEKMLEHGELTQQLNDILLEYSPEGQVSRNKVKTKREKFILNWDLLGDNTYMTQQDETGFIIFRMIKEIVVNMCKTYPNMILNEVNFNDRYVPKHWLKGSKKISDRHKNEVMGFMLKDGEGFSQFYKNKNINAILEYVLQNNEDLLMLMNVIPFYSGLSDNDRTGSIFDGEILKKLAYYFLLCSFSIYVTAFETNLRVGPVETEDFLDEAEDGEDLSIIRGEQEKLEKETCSLLNLYLKKIGKYKKLLNVSAETINKNVLKTKTKEKEQIVKRLGDLTVEQREIEDIMKNSSLGDWSLGRTKAIYEYDENQYDKEREKMDKDALMELRSGGLDDVSEFVGEIFNISTILDQIAGDDITRRIESEVYNLDGLPDDDDYDDRDGDDNGDYS